MRRKPTNRDAHMEFARRLFAGAFLLGITTGQVAAQENLGRLFFTEQQRRISIAPPGEHPGNCGSRREHRHGQRSGVALFGQEHDLDQRSSRRRARGNPPIRPE